jgi:hypothetical protein
MIKELSVYVDFEVSVSCIQMTLLAPTISQLKAVTVSTNNINRLCLETRRGGKYVYLPKMRHTVKERSYITRKVLVCFALLSRYGLCHFVMSWNEKLYHVSSQSKIKMLVSGLVRARSALVCICRPFTSIYRQLLFIATWMRIWQEIVTSYSAPQPPALHWRYWSKTVKKKLL